MGADRGAIDRVMAAVGHQLSQRDRNGFPDPSLAPTPETSVDRVPVPVLGRNIAPRRAAAKPPKYPIDDSAVLFRPSATATVRCLNRQQIFQNTPFCFCQIAPAQTCLQKATLNQSASATSTNLSTPPHSRFFPPKRGALGPDWGLLFLGF